MSVCANLKNYLLDHCFDLKMVAEKLDRPVDIFLKALNEEYVWFDERNIKIVELMRIADMANVTPDEIIYYHKTRKEDS